MRIMVLGAGGMLGHKMYQALRVCFPDTIGTIWPKPTGAVKGFVDQYPEDAFVYGIDLMDSQAVCRWLGNMKPDVVVNCVGVIKQRRAAKSAIPCISINSLMPHLLAEWIGGWGGRLIHFSTDCVFSGQKGNYTEDDASDAEDLYGKTKFLGEVAGENALTLRTSIIGRELDHYQSLLEWFLAQNGKMVNGYTKVIYSGVTTNYLAHLVRRIISEIPDLSGLYQVASPPISKYELLLKLRDAYNLNIQITPNREYINDRSMKADAFLQRTGWAVPCWDDLVNELVADPTPYHQFRQ